MIDKLLIKQRLSMIEDFCRELEMLKEMPKEHFLEKRNTAAAESFLRRRIIFYNSKQDPRSTKLY